MLVRRSRVTNLLIMRKRPETINRQAETIQPARIGREIYYPLSFLTIPKRSSLSHRTPCICSSFQPDHTLSQRQNRYHNSRGAIAGHIADGYSSRVHKYISRVCSRACTSLLSLPTVGPFLHAGLVLKERAFSRNVAREPRS